MGQRYEKNKKNVSENRRTIENLREEKNTLQNEYAPMSLLDSIESLLDDEVTDAVDEVRTVGQLESQRIETETDAADAEKEQIADEIGQEISKLNAGLDKLRQGSELKFGRKALEQSAQEYKKQIDRFHSLLNELGEQPPLTSAEAVSDSHGDNPGDYSDKIIEDDTVFLDLEAPNESKDPPIIGSTNYEFIVKNLKASNVSYRPIQLYEGGERATRDIVARLSGGDLTEGSCSSLALAYVGNKAGYDVLDFRDGNSRAFFSSRSSIEKIASLQGVNSATLSGTNDLESANQLLGLMTQGKEYYLATGQHASIVRRNDQGFEYLELQHPGNENGWHDLDNQTLIRRFGCKSEHTVSFSNYLIEVDSLSSNSEFLNILGYINTAEPEQRKGRAGNVR